ncbi:MAG: ThiF family adenylyltransferase [Planctomycetota bacterium]
MPELEKITVTSADGRFARFELISWWDQKRLARAKVLVVGAGALGNEVLKNLALLGVGNVFVIDLDTIEKSNLSRSVLFREEDDGKTKAEVAAKGARAIYPGMNVHGVKGNAVYDLGLGVHRWADIVIGGLDNREARLAASRACYKVNRPFVDGAIEVLNGIVRVFTPPEGACYECTMSENDWKMLNLRRSCALLTRDEMAQGRTPTTPTMASIVAGAQSMEAVKLLHGMNVLAGRALVFDGLAYDSYTITYPRKQDCYSHELFREITDLPQGTRDITARALLERARADLGGEATIELNEDVLVALRCSRCDAREEVFRSLGRVTEAEGRCPRCTEPREVELTHSILGDETWLDRTLDELGVPAFDIVLARSGEDERAYAFAGDAARVLGPLHAESTP